MRIHYFQFAALAFAANGCTLYQPLQASLPAVHKRGDADVRASWQVPYMGQVTGVWSPIPHGLVFASGGLHVYNVARDSSNNYARSRQYEAGFGGYTHLGPVWLSGAVGTGQGRGYRYGRFTPVDGPNFGTALPLPGSGSGQGKYTPVPELLGHYNTQFVQVMAQRRNDQVKGLEWGTCIRLTKIQFTGLALNGTKQPLPVQHTLQTEISAQYQWQRLKWQAAATYSPSMDKVSDERTIDRAPIRLWVGVVFQPRFEK